MSTVTINGFRDQEEAMEFCKWYQRQGEHDASIWFQCRKEEGTVISTAIFSNGVLLDGEEDIIMNVTNHE